MCLIFMVHNVFIVQICKIFELFEEFYILSNDNKVPEQVHSNQIQDLH